MNLKERIKSLRIPRLLIEAVLVFGSVYFALVLEADRTKDYEREKFIIELDQLRREMIADSVFYDAVFGDGEFSSRAKTELFKVAVDSLANLNYDFMRAGIYDFSDLHSGISTPIPESVSIIRNSYMDLIDDHDRLRNFRELFRVYDRLAEFDRLVVELENDFWLNKATNYKITGDYYRGPELELFLHSQELRRYAHKMYWYITNYNTFGGIILHNFKNNDQLISAEIKHQQQAMKGIF